MRDVCSTMGMEDEWKSDCECRGTPRKRRVESLFAREDSVSTDEEILSDELKEGHV